MSPETYHYIKPQHLKRGDTVALVNPVSVPPDKYRSQTTNSFAYLRSQGYQVLDYTEFNTDEPNRRIEAFNEAAQNSTVKAIFPVTGNRYGEDVVDKVDYDSLKINRPVFVTFSAASTFLLAIHERSNLVNFYGPHVTFLNDHASFRENVFTIASFWNMLKQESGKRGLGSNLAWAIFRWSDQQLRLRNIYSGNNHVLDTNVSFIGYKFDEMKADVEGYSLVAFLQGIKSALDTGINIRFRDKIVLLESNDIGFAKALGIIEEIKSRTDLKQAKAIVLASFMARKDMGRNELTEELRNHASAREFTTQTRKIMGDSTPVIYGFPIGHDRYKLTFPLGVKTRLNLETGEMILLESPFSG